MNVQQAPVGLPRFLVPFVTLSYPADPPARPDSFPHARYYGTGPLDLCFVLMWIGFLGIARELVRLKLFEPFARAWLRSADDQYERSKRANGPDEKSGLAPGSLPAHYPRNKLSKKEQIRERSVLRFGEQSYQWVYFVIYWSFGAVRVPPLPRRAAPR